jgi:hypothetical protein
MAKGGDKTMTMIARKALMMGLILLLRVTGMAATDGNGTIVARIKVRIWDRVHIESETLNRAKTITESLYRRGGIAIAWVHCTVEPTPENRACACPKGFNDISVRICPRARDVYPETGYFRGGVALPLVPDGASGIILLLYDRLERVAKIGNIPLELVLGITMAHEIGHLLISPGHAAAGIMRAKLDGNDWKLASRGALRFHSTEAEIMRARTQKRNEQQKVSNRETNRVAHIVF